MDTITFPCLKVFCENLCVSGNKRHTHLPSNVVRPEVKLDAKPHLQALAVLSARGLQLLTKHKRVRARADRSACAWSIICSAAGADRSTYDRSPDVDAERPAHCRSHARADTGPHCAADQLAFSASAIGAHVALPARQSI